MPHKPRKERRTYRCDEDGCNELHLSGGKCREHQEHAVQDEDTIITYADGTPEGLAERLEWLARRIQNESTALGALLRWEEKNRHDEREE